MPTGYEYHAIEALKRLARARKANRERGRTYNEAISNEQSAATRACTKLGEILIEQERTGTQAKTI